MHGVSAHSGTCLGVPLLSDFMICLLLKNTYQCGWQVLRANPIPPLHSISVFPGQADKCLHARTRVGLADTAANPLLVSTCSICLMQVTVPGTALGSPPSSSQKTWSTESASPSAISWVLTPHFSRTRFLCSAVSRFFAGLTGAGGLANC